METLEMQDLKKALRKEYEQWIKKFKERTTYEDLFNNNTSAKELAIIKELHNFCVNDLFYSYELIKEVYDTAYINGFNTLLVHKYTFYDYLLLKYKKI